MILFGDIETFSEVPIKHGHYRYAESAEVMLFAWAADDAPVEVFDFTAPRTTSYLNQRARLAEAFCGADKIVFHNSMFDRTVLRLCWEALGFAGKYALPPIERWHDTMVQALAHSLPGALEKLCAILNVPLDKRKQDTGKQLVQLFCKPRPKTSKIRRAARDTHPAEWAQFVDYAGHDVDAMRECYRRLPRWNYSGDELALWHLDQRINDRGFAVDLELADAAIATYEREQRRLAALTQELTGYNAETGEGVASATQRDKLLEHLLLAHNVALPDMKADTLERRLGDDSLPAPVRELIKIRLQAAVASVTKYKAIKRSASADGRMRGTIQFDGAQRTGRAAGRIVQPQNFMRTPKYLAGEVELAAGAVKANAADLVYPNTMEVLSASVPWAIVAPPGRKIVSADLSNIEGRVLAWLAGEAWKLQAFRDQDAAPNDNTRDLYIIGYARSFRAPIEDVVADYLAGGTMRQIGKVQELALGYQGAVGAFVSMAAVYGIDLEAMAARATIDPGLLGKAQAAWARALEDGRDLGLSERVWMVCWAFTQLWRRANPNIVEFWYALEDAARIVIRNPEMRVDVGRLSVDRVNNWMRIRLPSGRFLCYPSPRVDEETGKISYMGVDQYTRRWKRIPSYGGKFAENVTQAVSRDAFFCKMPAAEAAGYEIVLHVHDELATETPATEEFTVAGLSEILASPIAWADGLPLSAKGYESNRYLKD